MNTAEDIKKLADTRLEEAQVLLDNDKPNGAFYLLGYTIELYLKYKICKLLNIDDLFHEKCQLKSFFEGRNPFYSHNLETLLVYSGLKNKFDLEKSKNKIIFNTASALVGVWSENSRYNLHSSSKEDIQNTIDLLNSEKGLLKWIENN
jgi:hypothetical protein